MAKKKSKYRDYIDEFKKDDMSWDNFETDFNKYVLEEFRKENGRFLSSVNPEEQATATADLLQAKKDARDDTVKTEDAETSMIRLKKAEGRKNSKTGRKGTILGASTSAKTNPRTLLNDIQAPTKATGKTLIGL